MTIKEKIEIKLNLAQENLKQANRVRYCQGVIETCKFTLELLEKGD